MGYVEEQKLFYSMNYQSCLISFFTLDLQKKQIVIISFFEIQECKNLYGYFIKNQNKLILFYENDNSYEYLSLEYPSFKQLSSFSDLNYLNCVVAQNYYEQFELISSICNQKIQLFDLKGEYKLKLEIQSYFSLVKRESGKIYIYNLESQQIENKVTMKSNPVYIIKQDQSNLLFIGCISGDILITDIYFKNQKYIKIQNDLDSFFLHPILPKIYCIQLTNPLQQTDLNVGVYTQQIKEGEVVFNQSKKSIIGMHFSMNLKQIIIIQEISVYFIDIRTNQIKNKFEECQFEDNLIYQSFLDEKTNFLILSSKETICSVSLSTMKVVKNILFSSICSNIINISSNFSNNKDGLIQFIAIDHDLNQYIVILDSQDLNPIVCQNVSGNTKLISMRFDYESQTQFLLTTQSNLQVLTITDYKLSPYRTHILPQNQLFSETFFLCKQYAMLTNTRGLGMFISLDSYQILFSKQYFSSSIVNAYYDYDTKLLLISSYTSNFKLIQLDIETGEEIVQYQKQICVSNYFKVIPELNMFVVSCKIIPEDDNTYIKIIRLNSGEQIDSIQTYSYIHDSIFILPYDILLFNTEYYLQDDLNCIITQVNLSQFYNQNQALLNKSRQKYYINFIWISEQDKYFVATREGNIYEYYPSKSKFQLIEVIKNQILTFERGEYDYSKQFLFIQTPSQILLFSIFDKKTVQVLNYRNTMFLQLKSNYLIIKRPFTITILSKKLQLIKELNLLNKINEFQVISQKNEFALVSSFNGFVSLINTEIGELIWTKQIEYYRIQGIYIDQYFTILISFSREQKINIFTVNSQKNDIILQQSIQQQQPIKQIFIIENKIIISYLSFRYIDIYEYDIKNDMLQVQFIDFLIVPFRIYNYEVETTNNNTQLIVYSDFQVAIYSIVSNKILFKSSKSYFSNKIVQITSISNSIFLISCENDIEVIEINTEDIFYRNNYSDQKSLSLFSSNSLKIFNLIKKQNENNQIESLILIGIEIQSIKKYEIYLIDYSNNNNSSKECQISLKGVSYYDLQNKFQSLIELNKNEFDSYRIHLIIEQENLKGYTSIPPFLYKNQTTLVFDGSSNEDKLDFSLSLNFMMSLIFQKLEFINLNFKLYQEVQFRSDILQSVLIKNCSITSMYDTGGWITEILTFREFSELQIIGLLVENFFLEYGKMLFFRNISNIYISNLQVRNVSLFSSVFINCEDAIFIKINNILISNNTINSKYDTSTIFSLNKIIYLRITDSLFSENSGSKQLEKFEPIIIKCANCQYVNPLNNQFIKNQNCVLISISNKSILNSFETNEVLTYNLIYIIMSDILVQANNNHYELSLISIDSPLISNIAQINFISNKCLSQIIKIFSSQELKLNQITFENNIGITGIEIKNSQQILIKNCNFKSNLSLYNGGAIVIKNDELNLDKQDNNIQNCQFIQNTCLFSGGAIYLENISLNISDSLFQENSASIGGAIRYVGKKPDFLNQKQSNKYIKNKVCLYGQNLGSYPKYVVVDSRRKLNEFMFQNFRSGDTVQNIYIYILDEEKNIINTECEKQLNKISQDVLKMMNKNQEKIYEFFNNTQLQINNEISSYIITVQTSDSNLISLSNQTIFQYDTKNLFFNLQGLIIYGIPDQNADIQFQTSFIKEFNQSIVIKDNYNHTVNVKFRKCQNGEIYQKRTDTLYACYQCLDNRYSLVEPNITDLSQVCKQCSLKDSLSCELDQIQLKKGYWRESNMTDEIILCENNPFNCYGTNETNYCSPGYIGPLCEVCDTYGEQWGQAYARVNSYSCNSCDNYNMIYSKIIAIIVAVSIYFYYTVKKQLEKACKRAICNILRQTNLLAINMSCQRNEEINSIQKLLIHFLQITSVLYINKVLNFEFHEILSIFSQPQTAVSLSFDCILAQQKQMPIHFARAFYELFLPLQYIIVCILFQSIIWLFFSFEQSTQFIISSINFGILFFQTGIVKTLINVIFCRKIGSKFYIKSQINVLCYTSNHLHYIYTYFLPLGIILVFILPLLVLYNLTKNRKKLKYSPSAIIKFGLFFFDYKDKTYYWEFIKILLRLIITLVMNFFDQYYELKYDFCILILISYSLFVQRLRPYFLSHLNLYEIVLTNMTAILFMTERIIVSQSSIVSQIFSKIFFVIFVGICSFFAFCFIKDLVSNLKLFIIKKSNFLQKIFSYNPNQNSMKRFILWKKLKNNLSTVSQSIQLTNQANKTIRSQVSISMVETSNMLFQTYRLTPTVNSQKNKKSSRFRFKN